MSRFGLNRKQEKMLNLGAIFCYTFKKGSRQAMNGYSNAANLKNVVRCGKKKCFSISMSIDLNYAQRCDEKTEIFGIIKHST